MDFKIVWSEAAIADLQEIWTYFARQDPEAATQIGRGILAHARVLAEFPYIGPAFGLSDRDLEIFVDAVISLAEPVQARFLWRPLLRNPADEMVLEAAVNGRASALVTFNQRDFGPVVSRFGIEVLLPREMIGRIK